MFLMRYIAKAREFRVITMWSGIEKDKEVQAMPKELLLAMIMLLEEQGQSVH